MGPLFCEGPPQFRPLPEAASGSPAPVAALEEPGEEECELLTEPKLADTILAVTDLLSSAKGLDSIAGSHDVSSLGGGNKDPRTIGPPGPLDADGIPPKWQRWRVQYNTTSIEAYAQQLDSLGIEIGAAGGGRPQVDYVTQVAASKPRLRRGPGEARLYFSWQDGRLRAFDKRLLSKAGVPTAGRVILQFFPAELIRQMERAEQAAAAEKGLAKFSRTVFRVLPVGSKPAVEVVSID